MQFLPIEVTHFRANWSEMTKSGNTELLTSDGTRSRLVSSRDENGPKFLVSSRLEDVFQILDRDKTGNLDSRPRNDEGLLSKSFETRREKG